VDVTSWLRSLGLEEYDQAFRENAIDAEILHQLTSDDLKELGVIQVGHRRKLLTAIAALRESPMASVTGSSLTDKDTMVPSLGRRASAERRQLTVMFCDLVGSTALSARLDPEEMRTVIGMYHACVADVVSPSEGFVAKYMGDGVLIYFGYPVVHEDEASRAVRAGLVLVGAVSRLQCQAVAEPLQVRIGMATGLVIVGDLIGEGSALEQAVVGETPNLAARMQALAQPGEVVISSGTRRLIGSQFGICHLWGTI
jgi:class 3 adenylate cyclase